MSTETNHTAGPLESAHGMTALPMDHPRHRAYIAGFNDALKLADAKRADAGLLDALRDLLRFAEIWQGSSVEIIKARAAIALDTRYQSTDD
jgi:hypothetical protein